MEIFSLRQQIEALKCASHAIDIAQRGTGRTTRELEMVRDGDGIICAVSERAGVERYVRQHDLRVQVVCMAVSDFLKKGRYPYGAKSVHFTHQFIKEWIEYEITEMGVRMEGWIKQHQRPVPSRIETIGREPNPILEEIPFEKSDGPLRYEPDSFAALGARTFNER